MRAERTPQGCGNKLVSPSEQFETDDHDETNEQIRPIVAGGEGGERSEEEAGDDYEMQGLGPDVAAKEEIGESISAGSGGASSASAPGVRRQWKEDEDEAGEEEGEEGRVAKKVPMPNGPSKEERET